MKEETLEALPPEAMAILRTKYTGKHLGIMNMSQLGWCEARIATEIGKPRIVVAHIISEALRTLSINGFEAPQKEKTV